MLKFIKKIFSEEKIVKAVIGVSLIAMGYDGAMNFGTVQDTLIGIGLMSFGMYLTLTKRKLF